MKKSHNIVISNQALAELDDVRKSGYTNMFDYTNVFRYAEIQGYRALTAFMLDHMDNSGRVKNWMQVLTGPFSEYLER